MGGHQFGSGTGIKSQFQQVAAVQSENGASVRANVADRFEPCRKLVCCIQRGQQNQVVDLARPAVPFVDAADFAGDDKAGASVRCFLRQAQLVAKNVQAIAVRYQLLAKLGSPRRMCEVAGAYERNALAPRPPVQMRQVAVAAGSPGKAGMNVL